jgi:hypothetical protein
MKRAAATFCFACLVLAAVAYPAKRSTPTARTFTGDIVDRGGRFVLRDAAGQKTWRLDRQDKARPFAGQSVIVTGTSSGASTTIHVRTIEAAAASDRRPRSIPPEVAHPDPTGPITPPTFPSQPRKSPNDANPVKPEDPTKPTTTKPLG